MMTEPLNQTKKIKYSVKSIFIGMVAFFIVTMSLFHVLFDRFSNDYIEHKKSYLLITKERENLQEKLRTELGRTLTIEEYKKESKKAWEMSKAKINNYKKGKRNLAIKHSFLGRSSFKFWLFVFGLVLLGFYFSIKSLYHDYKRSIRTGHEIISIVGVSVSLFWFYHLFFQTAEDFYLETYLIFKFFICVAIGFFIAKLIQFFTVREGTIKVLLDLIIRIKIKHYRKMAVNALYAEKHDISIDSIETVKQQTDEFDKDIADTINKIAL